MGRFLIGNFAPFRKDWAEEMNLKDIRQRAPDLVASIEECDRDTTLAVLGALSIDASLHANGVRLDALIHLVSICSNGNRGPEISELQTWFSLIGDMVGHLEDPAEDFFTSYVVSADGGFITYEGLWEGNAFYTERLVAAVEKIPDENLRESILAPIIALLRLSDAIADRRGCVRYTEGCEYPLDELTESAATSALSSSKLLFFSDDELIEYDINPKDLSLFELDVELLNNVEDILFSETPLHRWPIKRWGDGILCILPSSFGLAIRLFAVRRLAVKGLLLPFQRTVCGEYSKFYSNLTLLQPPRSVPIGPMGERIYSGGFIRKFDEGRYLHFIPIISDLNNICAGVHKLSEDGEIYGQKVAELRQDALNRVKKKDDFVEILHLVSTAGLGEGCAFEMLGDWPESSRMVHIAPHDLELLEFLEQFDLFEIIRILDMQDEDSRQGLRLTHVNGFINLIGWLRANEGYALPPNIDDVELDGLPFMLNFDSNMQRKLRLEAYDARDPHCAQYVDGSYIEVQQYGKSVFAGPADYPVYVEPVLRGGKGMRLLVEANGKCVWAVAVSPEQLAAHMRFQKFEVIKTWLPRVVKAFNQHIGMSGFPSATEIEVYFAPDERFFGQLYNVADATDETEAELKALPLNISIIQNGPKSIRVEVPTEFDKKTHLRDNDAERILVKALLEALFLLAEIEPTADLIDVLLGDAVPNDRARQAHIFTVTDFRQSMSGRLPGLLKINLQDHARYSASEAWEYRDKSLGAKITGKADCLTYLRAVVSGTMDKLIKELSTFNRDEFLIQVAQYYEAANLDKLRWRATASASVALSSDPVAAAATIAEREGRQGGVLQGCRVLLEAGLFETAEVAGRTPGKLDVERLLLRALHVVQLGGFSDGIYWDVTPPNIQISPQGQIQLDQTFHRDVAEKLALDVANANIRASIQSYGEANAKEPPSSEGDAPTDDRTSTFLEALCEELGLSIDDASLGNIALERVGTERGEPVFVLTEEELNEALGSSLGEDKVSAYKKRFIFNQRQTWQEVSGGKPADMFPWRFRRLSSVLRKPILEISASDPARYLIIPGLIEEALKHQFMIMHDGAARPDDMDSKAMRDWINVEIGDREAKRFEVRMAKRLQDLGLEIHAGLEMSALGIDTNKRDFGDIDVLAFDAKSRLSYVIECKNFQMRKTPGELGERLSNFRGLTNKKGKPDLLRKHLNRVDLIRENQSKLAKFLGVDKINEVRSVILFPTPSPLLYSDEVKKLADILHEDILDAYFKEKG